MLTFKVVDTKTGKKSDLEKIALEEDWAKDLVYCDMAGFALSEDGELLLRDSCGNYTYCPPSRFEVILDIEGEE